jgi:anti-anti-sigma regulatory factor
MTLRIRKSGIDGVVVFGLIGRIKAEHLEELKNLFESAGNGQHIVLDLKEVKLVDQDAVEFLAICETNGTQIKNCPAYIREWILRERDR